MNLDPLMVPVEVPVGAVLPYAGPLNSCTRAHLRWRGWLLCDGAAVSRADYPELFAVIRRLYGYPKGQQDNAAIFCLPDYRGTFLRGLNRDADPPVDPEAAKRTHANPTAGNGNQGDQVGSRQGEAIQDHEHEYATPYVVPGAPPSPLVSSATLGMIYAAPPSPPPQVPPPVTLMAGVTATSETVVSATSTTQPDITETRPVNVAVNFIIKCRSATRPPGPIGDWCGNDTKDD